MHGIFQTQLPHKLEYTSTGTGIVLYTLYVTLFTGVVLDGSLQERAHEGGEVDGESCHTVSK